MRSDTNRKLKKSRLAPDAGDAGIARAALSPLEAARQKTALYLQGLPLSPTQAAALADIVMERVEKESSRGAGAPHLCGQAISILQEIIGTKPETFLPADAAGQIRTMPPFERSTMLYREPTPSARKTAETAFRRSSPAGIEIPRWRWPAIWRRCLFLSLVLLSSGMGITAFYTIAADKGMTAV